MQLLANMLSIYETAPWIFDGIIICTLLGLLFRILFEKAKIGQENQAKKLGGIFGFFLGIAMLGYMQYQEWTLFIDGGPWIFGIIIITLTGVLWAIVDGYFNHEKRTITMPLAFLAAMGMIYGFLNYLPSYMISVSDLFGGSVWIWHLIMWAGIIFVLFWVLMSAFAGGMPQAGPSFWSGIGSGIKAPFKAAGWILKGGTGAKDWWTDWRDERKKKAEARRKPAETPADTEQIDANINRDLAGANEQLDKTEQAMGAARALNSELAKKLNEIRATADKINKNVHTFSQENYDEIIALLENKNKELSAEKNNFDAIKLVAKLIDAQETIRKARTEIDAKIEKIRTYEKIRELAGQIKKISNEQTKAQFMSSTRSEHEHFKAIIAGFDTIIKSFEDAVKNLLDTEDIKTVQEKTVELDDKLTGIHYLLAQLINQIKQLKNASEDGKQAAEHSVNTNAEKVLIAATLAIESLENFNKTIIDSRLKSGVTTIESAIKEFADKKTNLTNEFQKIQTNIIALLAKVNEQLSKQATPQEQANLQASLQQVLNIINTERNTLLTLLNHAEAFVKVMNEAFSAVITGEQQIEAETTVKAGGQTRINTTGRTTEASIPTGENAAIAAIEKAKDLRKKSADELQAAKNTITQTISQLRYAQGQLTNILSKGLALDPEQKQKLEILMRNLNAFLNEEEDLKSLVTMLGSYEEYIYQMIMARVIKYATAQKKPKMTVSAAIKEIVGIINKLKKKIEALNVEAAYLKKVVREIPVPMPPGAATSRAPTEMEVPAPPAV